MPPKKRSAQSNAARAERAAAVVRERQRRERRRRNLSIGAVVLVIAIVVVIGFVIASHTDSSHKISGTAPEAGSQNGLTIGPDSAPHTVVVYEDFLCPFCGELEKKTHEKLESLADAGKVQVEYRPFDFLGGIDDYSGHATQAFASVLTQSGPNEALRMHDLLFENQPDESGPFPSKDDLTKLMTQAGADADTLTYFKAGNAETWAQEATDAAKDLGVSSTPTIILDGKQFQDGRTIDDIAANLLKAVS
jgi:protein-disulfide isomerase